jgi:hypothetical protein
MRRLHRTENKFFGSRRLRASPQGYSPWTSLHRGLDTLTHGVDWAPTGEMFRHDDFDLMTGC